MSQSELEPRQLPFFPPTTSTRRSDRIWRRHFVPELLAWAGVQENPFSVNNGIHTEVARIWESLYPRIPLSDDVNTTLTRMVK